MRETIEKYQTRICRRSSSRHSHFAFDLQKINIGLFWGGIRISLLSLRVRAAREEGRRARVLTCVENEL